MWHRSRLLPPPPPRGESGMPPGRGSPARPLVPLPVFFSRREPAGGVAPAFDREASGASYVFFLALCFAFLALRPFPSPSRHDRRPALRSRRVPPKVGDFWLPSRARDFSARARLPFGGAAVVSTVPRPSITSQQRMVATLQRETRRISRAGFVFSGVRSRSGPSDQ